MALTIINGTLDVFPTFFVTFYMRTGGQKGVQKIEKGRKENVLSLF